MDNTNNKNVFSLKLFWQTVIQLKVIGFISLAVVAFVSGFPIIIEGLNIKKMINAANAAQRVARKLLICHRLIHHWCHRYHHKECC